LCVTHSADKETEKEANEIDAGSSNGIFAPEFR
jgi:hypothetical protein